MSTPLSGPGVGLSAPGNLYPSALSLGVNAPYDFATNTVTLNAGDSIILPAGTWLVSTGAFSAVQFLDPVSGSWRGTPSGASRRGVQYVKSDGFNVRVINLLGCPAGAVITNAGANYIQASTSVTPSAGSSTWQAIVGGQLSVVSIAAAGANYTRPPIVYIPDPPTVASNGYGGVPATAYATLTNGTVSAVSLVNFGAGYTSAPTAVLLPDPTDPNFGTITQATIALGLTGTGKVTALLPRDHGAPLASVGGLTLTISGAGTTAAATAVVFQTVTNASVVAGGVANGNVAAPAGVGSAGGAPTATSAVNNPGFEISSFQPRPFQGVGVTNAGGTVSSVTVVDPGFFAAAPTPVLSYGASGVTTGTTGASIAFTMGSTYDTVVVQPAP